MLMLVVAFLVGLFFKHIMGPVCGGRSIEGFIEGFNAGCPAENLINESTRLTCNAALVNTDDDPTAVYWPCDGEEGETPGTINRVERWDCPA